MSSRPERFHCITLRGWQMARTGILSGCIYGILLETTNALYFFFFSCWLFKANGSESEQSVVTQAEIHGDLENLQMEKSCYCQPSGMIARALSAQCTPPAIPAQRSHEVHPELGCGEQVSG